MNRHFYKSTKSGTIENGWLRSNITVNNAQVNRPTRRVVSHVGESEEMETSTGKRRKVERTCDLPFIRFFGEEISLFRCHGNSTDDVNAGFP
jgi:hypothetical protein